MANTTSTISISQATLLLKIARESIKQYLDDRSFFDIEPYKKELPQKRGIFVTLKTYPSNMLRGCIGFPMPVEILAEAARDTALSAAFTDTRFPKLKKEELSDITIEISVLTRPKKIEIENTEELKKNTEKYIHVGKDGVIVSFKHCSGLLLPQVATEQNWDARTLLEQTCVKAGLSENFAFEPELEIQTFQAQIFFEETPNGKILEKQNP
ncbi:MAG: TIGR00296 family protein [Candidatus Diapherotrites archaeon]|nr:TIGR00296 family protein [Candidatus Diapherotrites archaeon]